VSGLISEHVLRIGAEDLPFLVRRTNRGTLGITVFPNGVVLASAPLHVGLEVIEERVRRRAGWILRTRREFEAFRPRTPPRRYVNGETHRFLGRQLRLAVRPEESRRIRVEGAFLILGGIEPSDTASIKRALQGWYHREARNVFADRLPHCLGRFAPERILTPPTLTVRSLVRRWGSMSRDGRRLMLNTRLVEAPRPSIDYVIVHELCHVVHPHHGPAFFELLQAKMPDWEKHKERLEKLLA
jgi:predicted metal-dependent hydrolase